MAKQGRAFIIEARDQQTRSWDFSAVCQHSVKDCAWDSADEAELVIHDMRGWSDDWAGGDYRIVEVRFGQKQWPGYEVEYVRGEFYGDASSEE
jgi:hypothetical protein